LPSGNECGNAAIATGGNNEVGCDGAGDQAQNPGGYDNNEEITEGPWCLTEGEEFDLFYADDWGDGGISFDILVNGYEVSTFDGVGLGGTYTFTAAEPPAYDLALTESNLNQYVAAGSFDIEGHVFNAGTETIESFDLNYSVDGGAAQTYNVSGASIENYGSAEVAHDTPWEVNDFGVYTISMWTDNLNGGNADENNANDTLIVQVEVGPGTPNIIDDYLGVETPVIDIAGPSEDVNRPTDLDFHPILSNNELWVINKDSESTGGSTVTIYNAGEESQTELWKRDGNAWHFMSLPTGIAFSENGNFANSPGVYDANHNGGDAFTGPALWSSNMDIYAEPSGGNGSHLDMTHQSPYSQGIAAETGNAFWVFDGYSNDIVRNDFVDDHGPGNDFHADAIILRYAEDAVQRDEDGEAVSHLVVDANDEWLYVVDHGNDRVIRIDINSGTIGGEPDYPPNEPYEVYENVTGYTQEDVVTNGLTQPAGIDVIEDRMIVSEHESGDIVIYDISSMPATQLERINTGFSSLQGIKIGPEGYIWGVDFNSDSVFKLGIGPVSVTDEFAKNPPVMYPNPATDQIFIKNGQKGMEIHVYDQTGRLVQNAMMNAVRHNLNISSLPAGIYSVRMTMDNYSTSRKVVKL
jgi:hypothetical protein